MEWLLEFLAYVFVDIIFEGIIKGFSWLFGIKKSKQGKK